MSLELLADLLVSLVHAAASLWMLSKRTVNANVVVVLAASAALLSVSMSNILICARRKRSRRSVNSVEVIENCDIGEADESTSLLFAHEYDDLWPNCTAYDNRARVGLPPPPPYYLENA